MKKILLKQLIKLKLKILQKRLKRLKDTDVPGLTNHKNKINDLFTRAKQTGKKDAEDAYKLLQELKNEGDADAQQKLMYIIRHRDDPASDSSDDSGDDWT